MHTYTTICTISIWRCAAGNVKCSLIVFWNDMDRSAIYDNTDIFFEQNEKRKKNHNQQFASCDRVCSLQHVCYSSFSLTEIFF